jgi:serine/threonine protein kinase
VSSDARDFISALMQKEPSRRFSASQALSHKWMVRELSEGRPASFNPAVLESLESFAMSQDIRKVIHLMRPRIHTLVDTLFTLYSHPIHTSFPPRMVRELSEGRPASFNPAVLESLESFAMSQDIRKARVWIYNLIHTSLPPTHRLPTSRHLNRHAS